MSSGDTAEPARDSIVLLHALGSSRHSWDPIVPMLRDHVDVHALDLPGFGDSAPLPDAVVPTPAALAAAVASTLDARGIREPHVVGNSLGGWVALELAALRPLASITLLSPAGMWPGATPWYCRVSLRATRWLAVHLPTTLGHLVSSRVGRTLVLGQSHGRPWRVSAAQARAAVRAMGTAPAFDATLAATLDRKYAPEVTVDVPVTVAYGSRDLILPRRRWRRTDRLPPHTWIAELSGCGHLPMADDPHAVAQLVLASVRASVGASVRTATRRGHTEDTSGHGLSGFAAIRSTDRGSFLGAQVNGERRSRGR